VPERYLGHSFGKYRVESLIGSGGFAWVFKGYDPELEIPVAIKVLKPQFAGDPKLVDRFRREASTAAKLRHPNIIKIYAVGTEGDAVYFVMDYLPTGLAEKLETTNALPEDYVARVGVDVARALGFAHREGVIHRDIKVDNILFDVHGNAVVADFGIARAVTGYTQHTGTNMVVGTPQYFAPEQARAKPLDGRADIYSLGVTMFRASTGRLPFEGDDWYEIARMHVEEPPPAPRSIMPSLSAGFERVVLQCLAKSPDDRPASGEFLAEELDQLLAQHKDPTLARTLTVPAHTGVTLSAPALPALLAAPKRRVAKVLVPVLLGVAALGAFAAWRYLGPAAPGTSAAQGPVVVAPTDTIPPAAAGVVADTTKGARIDTTGPLRIKLTVTVPTDAQLTVNDIPVALDHPSVLGAAPSGRFSTDTLKKGVYKLSAFVIPGFEGCKTAKTDTSVTLNPSNIRTYSLAPRGCGAVDIKYSAPPKPGEVKYTLTPLDQASTPRQGTLTLGDPQPVVVPSGHWILSATKPQCTPYGPDTISVSVGRRESRTFALFCP
jgi:eukaryotic-like serine/threonine-protein kinase